MNEEVSLKARAVASDKVRVALQEYVNAGREPEDVRLVTDWSLITAMTHPEDNMTAYRIIDSSPAIHQSIGLHQAALKILDDVWEASE